ncbi:MAG: 5,10-methylenetetrahydrofolate reductase, partial [Pseudomonadota bacterium]|nr:5,10-methylenetetrahydrofolate reductase [Pseudomonadota bacterium]
MIRSITQQKPEEELDQLLDGLGRVFIIGCGTCATLTQTGGVPEVSAIKKRLSEKGKMVTGDVVLAVACDNLTRDALAEYGSRMDQADVLLIMACAFGV